MVNGYNTIIMKGAVIMAKPPVLTEYNITGSGFKTPLTIALAADIHERPDDRFIELIKQAEPDIIAIAGDTLERYDGNKYGNSEKKPGIVRKVLFEIAYYVNRAAMLITRNKRPPVEKTYAFLEKISEIAPVYMSVGNHEQLFLSEDFELFNRLGITLLDNRDVTAQLKGRQVILGGLSTFFDEEWLKSYTEKDGYKILLSHHPIYYDRFIKDADIDLMLAGHNHGGQVRLFGKGLLSSGEGIPPKYDRGVFDNRLVVSAGCANTVALPRLGNPREIVKIRLSD